MPIRARSYIDISVAKRKKLVTYLYVRIFLAFYAYIRNGPSCGKCFCNLETNSKMVVCGQIIITFRLQHVQFAVSLMIHMDVCF